MKKNWGGGVRLPAMTSLRLHKKYELCALRTTFLINFIKIIPN